MLTSWMAKHDGSRRLATGTSVMHKSWYRLLQVSKRRRRLQRLKDRETTDDGESADGVALPEHLLETVLSKIPYPHVFKTRFLSKTWYDKFPVDGEGPFPTPFQEEIKSAATRWPSFCPVYFSPAGSLIGFNSTTESWETISVSPSLPSALLSPSSPRRERRLYFGGSLLAMFDCGTCQRTTAEHHLFVMNIQTGSWREIAFSHTRGGGLNSYVLLMNDIGIDGYKLLVNHYYNSRGSPYKTEVFDSSSSGSSWTTSSYRSDLVNSPTEISEYCVYHDGSLFCMEPEGKVGPIELVDLVDPEVVRIWKFNLKFGVWTESRHIIQLQGKAWSVGGVFRCGPRLLLATIHEEPEIETEIETDIDDLEESWEYIDSLNLRPRARIYEIMAETLDIVEISVSPLDIYPGGTMMSDRNCIYFAQILYNKTSVACYNVTCDTWSRLPNPPTNFCRNLRALGRPASPWARSAYEPGVNPFASA